MGFGVRVGVRVGVGVRVRVRVRVRVVISSYHVHNAGHIHDACPFGLP